MLILFLYHRAAYSGTALAFRDRLIIEWNKTQQRQTLADQKRVYCKRLSYLALPQRNG
jgi:starch phosphorylase